MSADRTFQAPTFIFDRTGLSVQIDVPAGHRLVFLSSADAATVAPDLGPGTVEVSADALAGCSPFPIAVALVPDEHVPAWSTLTQEQVGRMLARCAREVASVRETGARVQ